MTIQQQHEIDALKREIEELRWEKECAAFAKDLGETLAFIMARNPSTWTDAEKLAFSNVRNRYSTIADEWRRRLETQ